MNPPTVYNLLDIGTVHQHYDWSGPGVLIEMLNKGSLPRTRGDIVYKQRTCIPYRSPRGESERGQPSVCPGTSQHNRAVNIVGFQTYFKFDRVDHLLP